jgi:uncharacterized phosphosugar-binding protein
VMNLLPVPGAVGVDVRPATLGSALERVDGLAAAVLDAGPVRSGDLLFVISLSGRNALPVEMAAYARSLGLKVIGVTSVAYTQHTTSRHASGTFLKDHCDIVLDSRIPVGDAELTAEGVPAPFAPACADAGRRRHRSGRDGRSRHRSADAALWERRRRP